VALLNTQINEQNASLARRLEGKAEVEGLKSREAIASTKVVQSASGFDVNSGRMKESARPRPMWPSMTKTSSTGMPQRPLGATKPEHHRCAEANLESNGC